MFDRIFKFFSSLWLTVVLLALALILVFVGTIAQVKLGLYEVQSQYFRSLFVYWKPQEAGMRIPIFPGGWLLGGLLLVNLIAAHIKRFKFTWKKSGIFLTHFGLILLLAGQFLTEVFQVESTMRLTNGETRNYTEDSRRNELVVIDTSNPESDHVVSIPESFLKTQKEIRHPELPFTIHVKDYAANSDPAGPMTPGNKISATEGIGKRLSFVPKTKTTVMEDEDKPTAHIELTDEKGVKLGDWAVSIWLTRYPYPDNIKASVGGMLSDELDKPQSFTYNGHTYELALRPTRYYKPYHLRLEHFSHDRYAGTDIPKNFSSKVHLSDASKGEERDVLIYMNNPLRYGGETFFQSGFMPDDKGTILQVVNNPAAITPYVSCLLVGVGLIVQFLMHLVNFGRGSRDKKPPTARKAASEPAARKASAALEPATVAERKATT